jgi:hypothetical protein
MRRLVLALVSTTAMVTFAYEVAHAQSTSSADNTGGISECDKLITKLRANPEYPGFSVDDAQKLKQNNNNQQCRDVLARIESPGDQAAESAAKKSQADQVRRDEHRSSQGQPTPAQAGQAHEGQAPSGTDQQHVVVQQPAQRLQIEQPAPQVRVSEPQPEVSVNQPAPEVIVRQPAPTVTIDIPQPEITVRMPKPQVNVATAQPQVEVNQPKPKVELAPTPQPEVQVQSAKPNVTVQQPNTQARVTTQEAQPQVHFERAQPKVVINQPQGQPQVHVEQTNDAGVTNATSGSQHTGGPQAANSANATAQPTRVAELLNAPVKSADGQNLGTVDRVVTNTGDAKQYIVLKGQGSKEVMVPLDQLSFQNGQVVANRGVTNDQLRGMPAWDANNQNYKEMKADQTLQISRT